jgi:membrane protease YdiL (CAAX protease family)
LKLFFRALAKDTTQLIAKFGLFVFIAVLIFLVIRLFVGETSDINVPIFFTLLIFICQFCNRVVEIKFKKEHSFLGLILDFQGVKDFFMGSGVIFVMMILASGIELSLGWIKFSNSYWDFNMKTVEIYMTSIVLALLSQIPTAWWEELVFRGYLVQKYKTNGNQYVSFAISTLLFGVVHHFFPPKIPWEMVPFYAIGGCFLVWFYVRKGLWCSIGFHLAWNIRFSVFNFMKADLRNILIQLICLFLISIFILRKTKKMIYPRWII